MKNLIKALVFFNFLNVFAQIEKVEPPFWWSDMQKDSLQILLYGKDLSDYKISIENLSEFKIDKVENPNYVFVTISSKDIQKGSFKIQLEKDGSKISEYNYEIKPREAASSNREGFDSSDVMYLLMPDRFANGDPSNDENPNTAEKPNRLNPGGRHGGDIQGIIDHLDYLNDLGITAIWSTPLLEDNEPTYSYHTYAQSDLYKIDPRYGTNELYRELAEELHKRDMKLIMDYVTNHWGSKHWMIKDLPEKDWIHQWPEGFRRSNYRMTTQFDQNTAQIDAKGCMEGWFDTTMPDVNQNNPRVLHYLIQNAIWWIEFAGLDGLRVDTYSYNDKLGISKWTEAIMQEYPNFNIVGEVWMHDQAQIAYWQKDSKIGELDQYNSHLPSVMDFTLHDAILQMFTEDEESWNSGIIKAYENFTNDFLYSDVNNLLIFMGNHDTNRINEIFESDINKYKLALTLILTTRGIPQLYYGDEIGMLGNRDKKGDGDIRKDFPGGWKEDKGNAFDTNGRTKDQEAYHAFTKKILNWRKGKEVIHKGKLLHYIPYENCYVFFRLNEKESVMIIINNNNKDQTLDLNRFSEGLKNYTKGFDIISDENLDLNKEVFVLAKSSRIIELNN